MPPYGTSKLGLVFALVTVLWGYIWAIVALCLRMELLANASGSPLDSRETLTVEAIEGPPAPSPSESAGGPSSLPPRRKERNE